MEISLLISVGEFGGHITDGDSGDTGIQPPLLHPHFTSRSAATASPPNQPGDGWFLSGSESRRPQGDRLIPRVNNAGGIEAHK